jgi:methylthioribose-1-phosphate isomerase
VSFLDDNLSPLRWDGGVLLLLDQKALPSDERWLSFTRHEEVAAAIVDLTVRGAPAIGCAAAYAVALGARQIEAGAAFTLASVYETLGETRPTAVNLFWALARMRRVEQSPALLLREAKAIQAEDILACRRIGARGAKLIPEGGVLTHCNAGALATGGYGTALGVLRAMHADGRAPRVFADETRPVLQGARLTAWELMRSGLDVTLIADGMAAHFMARGQIRSVIVGADRIAANGDVANKIGTYAVALAAHAHGLPLFVAAPWSTVDLATPDGVGIVIEERAESEITHHGGRLLAPAGVRVANPAFDVTPARYVRAIITERGVALPPFSSGLAALGSEI